MRSCLFILFSETKFASFISNLIIQFSYRSLIIEPHCVRSKYVSHKVLYISLLLIQFFLSVLEFCSVLELEILH